MSGEIKRRVILASVLKPVDDTRMLEKIGTTLVKDGFEVVIIGFPSPTQNAEAGIKIIPLPSFRRLSFKRLIIPWIIYRKINQLKPEIVIINTPELLFITILGKLFSRRKIVYDVLENYYRNIRYMPTYPPVIRFVLAHVVRLTEISFTPFIDQFFLAEKGYIHELKFVRQPLVLENKLPKKIADKYPVNHAPYYKLFFSGTLAPTTGVFEAISLSKSLHALNPDYSLTIIGYAAKPDVLRKIRQEIAEAPFIRLMGGDHLVPHDQILEGISQAGTGIIIYPNNAGTENSIPTKLYEYLALKLPVIISHTDSSIKLVERYNAGIVATPQINAATLNEQLASSTFTFDYGAGIFWEEDAKKLPEALKR